MRHAVSVAQHGQRIASIAQGVFLLTSGASGGFEPCECCGNHPLSARVEGGLQDGREGRRVVDRDVWGPASLCLGLMTDVWVDAARRAPTRRCYAEDLIGEVARVMEYHEAYQLYRDDLESYPSGAGTVT